MVDSIIFVLIVFVCTVIGVAIWFACIAYLIRGVDDEEYEFKIALTTILSVVPCLALTLIGFGGFLVWLLIPSQGVSVLGFLLPFLFGVFASVFSYLIGSMVVE